MKILSGILLGTTISLALLFAPVSICAKGDPPGEIGIQEAAQLIKKDPDDLLILDVRTPAEFRQGHIPNARNMDFFGGRFDIDVATLPKDKTILVYCRSGKRSAGAAETLREAGIKNILHMTQGMEAWEKDGLPVVRNN